MYCLEFYFTHGGNVRNEEIFGMQMYLAIIHGHTNFHISWMIFKRVINDDLLSGESLPL